MTARALPLCGLSLAVLLSACSSSNTPANPGTGGGSSSSSGGSSTAGSGGSGGGVGSSASGGAPASGTGGTVAGSGGASTGTGGTTAGTGGTVSGTGASTSSSGGGPGSGGGAGGARPGTGGAGLGGSVAFPRPLGVTPNKSYPASMVNVTRANWKMDLVSPDLNNRHHHNQPSVINGYLMIAGNEEFWFYDISDPAAPKQLSQFNTPNRCATCGGKGQGEAESHTVAFARYGDKYYTITTGGRGVDIWDITDVTKPVHSQQLVLPGIDYGDFTSAVWGLSWEGDYIYVGSTNNGIDILDAKDPTHVTAIKRIPTSAFGGVSAGPLDAIGNILVVRTPKDSGGIATLDISDPVNPVTLDYFSLTTKSYIGQFYRHYVFLLSPLRAWDVLSDPTNIGTATTPLGSLVLPTTSTEYLSFSDDFAFVGHIRPDAGASKVDISDVANMKLVNRIWGRLDRGGINDDQFTIAIGSNLVMGDDQEPYAGSVIAVHSATPDTKPPVVDTIIPRDKSTGQSTKSGVGISFSDNIELATVNGTTLIVRPVGGQPLPGKWGGRMGVITFDPDQDFLPATTYEVILPKGGLTDLVRNPIAAEFRSTFTTR